MEACLSLLHGIDGGMLIYSPENLWVDVCKCSIKLMEGFPFFLQMNLMEGCLYIHNRNGWRDAYLFSIELMEGCLSILNEIENGMLGIPLD